LDEKSTEQSLIRSSIALSCLVLAIRNILLTAQRTTSRRVIVYVALLFIVTGIAVTVICVSVGSGLRVLYRGWVGQTTLPFRRLTRNQRSSKSARKNPLNAVIGELFLCFCSFVVNQGQEPVLSAWGSSATHWQSYKYITLSTCLDT